MNPLLAAVDARDKGAIPVSIGTSLALESVSGVFPDQPVSPAPILSVKEMWFNVRTLLRNLLGGLPGEVRDLMSPAILIPALVEELGIIESAVVKASNGRCRAVFYCCDYTLLSRKFPKATLKTPTTPKQQLAHRIEETTITALLRNPDPYEIKTFRFEITGRYPDAFILTHLPVDLLSKYSFSKLELVESHTGKIKPAPQWNTKLTAGKDLVNIPFNAFSLQVFGDNGNHFQQALSNIRREVLTLAEEDGWTAVSTEEKIRFSVRKVKNPTDRTYLMSML